MQLNFATACSVCNPLDLGGRKKATGGGCVTLWLCLGIRRLEQSRVAFVMVLLSIVVSSPL